MNIKLLPGLLLTIIYVIFYLFIVGPDLKIYTNDDRVDMYNVVQIIGNPKDNTLLRSILSSHVHNSLDHLITNTIALNIASYLLTDITKWYFPINVFYLTILIEHVILELNFIKLEEMYTVGASGGILGIYGFYFSYILLYKISNFDQLSDLHKFGFFSVTFIFIDVIYKFYREIIKKDNDNISDLSHFSGFIIGAIIGLLYYFYKNN